MSRVLLILTLFATTTPPLAADVVQTRQSGPWSDPATWRSARVPQAGDSVHVKAGHRVVYDVASEQVIRVIHVAGTLAFATDRDTRLDVGLIRVQPGETFAGEDGFDCHARPAQSSDDQSQAALEVGSAAQPIPPQYTALIRLTYVEGMDRESCPAIVACGGRMGFHGAAMNRTWVKLGLDAAAGESHVFLDESVTGWDVGDSVIITATSRQILYTGTYTKTVAEAPRTEERTITRIDRHHGRMRLTLDRPLAYAHRGEGPYRGEVANLSRNVIVESAAPDGVRGHTMYHHGSAGSIGYAEFRHLGKKGILGRYPLHWHHAADSMRGSSVVGASIWDSQNHLLTIHNTRYLVVRDCVGYRSVGHGFYLEDGTEAFNVLDRNLAVQALRGDPLPGQFLPFDRNDGAGFWWANSRNTFTRNVAVECDQYGFRFEAVKSQSFHPTLPVPQADGSTRDTDLRTIPFIRFEGNEAHAQRRFGLNLGGIPSHRGYGGDDPNYSIQTEDVDGVGPDRHHPFVLRDTLLWDCHWPFHAGSPMVIVEGMDIADSEYGLWRSVMLHHQYQDLSFRNIRSHAIFFPRTGGENQFIPADEPSAQRRDGAPPFTVITSVTRDEHGRCVVRGTTSDDGALSRVIVNNSAANLAPGAFGTWSIVLDASKAVDGITAHAIDAAGNVEPRPHAVAVPSE